VLYEWLRETWLKKRFGNEGGYLERDRSRKRINEHFSFLLLNMLNMICGDEESGLLRVSPLEGRGENERLSDLDRIRGIRYLTISCQKLFPEVYT
jgi:hypothetical protein